MSELMQEYQIVEVAGRGRCFKAAKNYRRGDKIHSEKPYEAVLYDASAASQCHHTFEKSQQLHRCVAHSCSSVGSGAAIGICTKLRS